MNLCLFILTLLVLHNCFGEENEEKIDIEVSALGEQENINNAGFSETGPPSDPPLVFRGVDKPPSNQYWVSFINKSPKIVELYWDDGGRAGRLQATLDPGEKTRIGTFDGHIFYFRYPNNRKREYVANMVRSLLVVEFKDEETRNAEKIKYEEEKRIFKEKYLVETGRKWEAYYPRNKPIHYMYPGEYIGQKHSVTSNHSFYSCYPVTDSDEDISKCRNDSDILTFEWEIVSTSPRVIWLTSPFLSEFEMNHIKILATPILEKSTVGHGSGAYASSSRTSSGCFIERYETDVIDWIFRRIGDVLQIEESFLWHMVGAESLQVLKYDKSEQFKPHPDYNTNRPQMRYLTFLMYLNTLNDDQGGKTRFPLANISVTPQKGHAAAFYNILEDGNIDYMSLHQSTPIEYGTKWSCPLWIWDPTQS